MAPLIKYEYFGREFGIILAMFLGFGFGFFLEKAGFGSGKKLCDVWYGRDFAVIRVMFTAVVVAMLGIFGMHYAGLMDLDQLYINPTFLYAQIVGGFLLGAGFSIGGYCPGTSAVAISSGKLDGLVFTIGFLVGIVLFSEMFPVFENLYNSGSMGRKFLYEPFGISPGLAVFLVVLMAIGTFVFVGWIEKKVNKGKES
ncbi:MAG: YeeE/YedE family protein [Leptospiraceae bacterium]|nr:YeeE/YedE family protein [Leptospiraceae bacterium]